MKRPNRQLAIGAIAAVIALLGGSAIVSGAGAGDDGTVLVPAVPVRILDTRLGSSSIRTLSAGEEATVSFAQAVPAGTRAVDINVTTTDGTQASFLAVYPTGMQRPITSAVNWNGPTSQANSIAVKVNNNYEIDIYNAFGNVDVVIDMMGYYIDAPTGGAAGEAGLDGTDGSDGTDGAPGIAGPAGVNGAEVFFGDTVDVIANPTDAVANCPVGKVAVSGGYKTSDALNESNVIIFNSYPINDTQWQASGTVRYEGAQYSLTAYVICATDTTTP